MIFTPPAWVPQGISVPTGASIGDVMLNRLGALNPDADDVAIIVAEAGQTYKLDDLRSRVDRAATTLQSLMGWSVTSDASSWDRIVAVFAENSVDYLAITWAVHRLGGICLLLHSTSTVQDIQKHLSKVKCRAVFTTSTLLPKIEQAQKDGADVPGSIFVIGAIQPSLAPACQSWEKALQDHLSDDIPSQWSTPAPSQVAYLCPTSGTSGTQKLAKMSHENVIANVLQSTTLEGVNKKGRREVGLAILPLSHIYGILISHLMIWRGDTMVLHSAFDMQKVLASIAQHRIERLYLVPSIVAALVANKILFKVFDLSSVNSVSTGAGSLTFETAEQLEKLAPHWEILPGYGTTESGGLASYTSADDTFIGSSGSLLPHTQAQLMTEDGTIVEGCDAPGEILLKSPSIISGYVGAEDPDLFTADGWLRTGDVGVFRTSPKGHQHLFVIDRLKDMLKVKGMQVAPAEIEAELLRHSNVAEAAVVGDKHKVFGERAKAWIVLKDVPTTEQEAETLKEELAEGIAGCLPETHWLGNRIEFTSAIPKSPAGKVLKRLLREKVDQ